MTITGSIIQPGCCSMAYELSRPTWTTVIRQINLRGEQPEPNIISNIRVYKWFNPLIIFLRIFDSCFRKVDSFQINGQIFYCFKSDIMRICRTFASMEGQLADSAFTYVYRDNNVGVATLETFVSKVIADLTSIEDELDDLD